MCGERRAVVVHGIRCDKYMVVCHLDYWHLHGLKQYGTTNTPTFRARFPHFLEKVRVAGLARVKGREGAERAI